MQSIISKMATKKKAAAPKKAAARPVFNQKAIEEIVNKYGFTSGIFVGSGEGGGASAAHITRKLDVILIVGGVMQLVEAIKSDLQKQLKTK